MGTASSRPEVASRPLFEFPYSKPEPWSWVPGLWIQPGTIFVTAAGRFYRLVERLDDGWRAEELAPAAVGPQPRITEIKELRSRYDEVLAAHDELDLRMKNGEDTPESRSLLCERDAEMHRLRDRLILLCNGRSVEARTAAAHPNRWRWTLVAVLAVGFVIAVASCIRRLYLIVPQDAGRMVAGAAFFLAAVTLAVIGFQELSRRRNKLVTGNLVGCYTLVVVGIAVAAFAVMLVSVLLLYTGGYNN